MSHPAPRPPRQTFNRANLFYTVRKKVKGIVEDMLQFIFDSGYVDRNSGKVKSGASCRAAGRPSRAACQSWERETPRAHIRFLG